MVTNSIVVIEHEMSMDDDYSQVYDVPSPEAFMPTTPEYSNDAVTFHDLDDAGFTTHAFLQVGIPITSKGILSFLLFHELLLLNIEQSLQRTIAPRLDLMLLATSSSTRLMKLRKQQQVLASMADSQSRSLRVLTMLLS